MRSVGACRSGSSTMSPRAIASLVMPSPARLSAQRSPGRAALGRAVLRVDRAHARREAGRADGHVVADVDVARQHRAGDDGAGARQRERSGRPRGGSGPARRAPSTLAAAANRRSRSASMPSPVTDETGRMSAPASPVPSSAFAISAVDLGAPLGRREIGLGQRDDAARDAEQVDDRQMLARLRHHAVVGGDDQQHEVDAGRAGQHVVHEPLVPGHVDEAEHRAVRRRQVGEAEIDRDAARLLLLQAVGIDAGQRAHQRGLAVVDMAGGADDHGAGSSGAAARRSASAALLGRAARRATALEERDRRAGCRRRARAVSQAKAATGSRADAGAEMIGGAEHRLARRRRRARRALRHQPAAAPASRSTPSALW